MSVCTNPIIYVLYCTKPPCTILDSCFLDVIKEHWSIFMCVEIVFSAIHHDVSKRETLCTTIKQAAVEQQAPMHVH